MTSPSLPHALTGLLEALRAPRHRLLVALAALALARVLYHRRQRHNAHVQFYASLTHHLADHAVLAPAAGPAEEWHEVTADGVLAQSLVYYPAADSPAADVLVLVLPGNPGTPHFLLPLIRELATRSSRRFEVRCFSQTGHTAPWKNGGRLFSLQEQVEHKLHYIGARLKENPRLRLVLIGHSIGCHLSVQVATKFPDAVERIVFMQPAFAHMGSTPKGREMAPVFAVRGQAVRFVKLLEYLFPMTVRRWLVSLAIGRETEEVLHLASLSLVSSSVMRNVLHMALHEMQEVHEIDADAIRHHEAKTLFVFSPVDGWVPPEFVQKYQLLFPQARHRIVPQGHAFMMETNGSRDMAAHIAPWLEDIAVKM
jgi:pimeloyl-ACP methyl ester carboxylesterase